MGCVLVTDCGLGFPWTEVVEPSPGFSTMESGGEARLGIPGQLSSAALAPAGSKLPAPGQPADTEPAGCLRDTALPLCFVTNFLLPKHIYSWTLL